MRQDKLAFPEAVRELASAWPGWPCPKTEAAHAGGTAARSCSTPWPSPRDPTPTCCGSQAGARAREYLDRRGIDPSWPGASAWGSPPRAGSSPRRDCAAEGVGEDVLVAAGLVVPRQGGTGVYDRFRGRLLFPISDLQGRVVAFGGRALGDEQPKYLRLAGDAHLFEGQPPLRHEHRAGGDAEQGPCATSSRATSTASWRISTASRRRWPPSAPRSRPPSSPSSAASR